MSSSSSFARSDVGIQALAGGSLEIAGSSSDAPIAAVEKGLDLVIVGGIINGLTPVDHGRQEV